MTWLLTMIIVTGGEPVAVPVGLMSTAQTCRLAGASMAQAIMLGTPGVVVMFACTPPAGVLS